MSTRFVTLGLYCILALGYVSSTQDGLNKVKLYKFKPFGNDTKRRTEINLKENPENGTNGASFRPAARSEGNCFPILGCFENGKPWNSTERPVGVPEEPEKIRTTLGFYSRENIPYPTHIPIYPQVIMNGVPFAWDKRTVIIVHGFETKEKDTWMEDLKDAYLKHIDANVMVVDWGQRNFNFNYFQVVTSIRVIGRQLALFLEHLITHYQADPGRVHLIGHGLGAHVCSYLAKEVPKIGRITALDPAQPYFEGFPKEVRIDKSDARFVELIHTDAMPFIPHFGFGMIAPHGHVDFYVNGGYNQPGCYTTSKSKFFINKLSDTAKYTFTSLSEWLHCSHARAYQYFISAVSHTGECTFWGQQAKEKVVFQSRSNLEKKGFPDKLIPVPTACTEENCIMMGLHTQNSNLRGVFLVTTTSKEPYCIMKEKENTGGLFSSVLNTVASIPSAIGSIFGFGR